MVAAEAIDRVRRALSKRRGSKVRGLGLDLALARDLGITAMEARSALNALRDAGELKARDWHPRLGPQGMVSLNLAVQTTEAQSAWQKAMARAGYSSAERGALAPAGEALRGMGPHDLDVIARGLQALRGDLDEVAGQSRFLVSAQYLGGSSKMLDALPNAALRAIGIEPGCFQDAPGYVLTAGPAEPEAVCLVENPQAFEMAVRAAVPGIAWIATYGYGLSRSGEAFGEQLAGLIETGRMVQLIRDGNPRALPELLSHPNLTFWGDLDPAGLHIFDRLKRRLPQLKLSSLYAPMLEQLREEGGHPYVSATGKQGQTSMSVSDPQAKALMERCVNRGLDQEVVTPEVLVHTLQTHVSLAT